MLRGRPAAQEGEAVRLLDRAATSATDRGPTGPEPAAAVKGTGLEGRHAPQYSFKRAGREPASRRWASPTAAVDTRTHFTTGAAVSAGPSDGSPQFPRAIAQASRVATRGRVLAGAALDGEDHHRYAREDLGGRSTAIPLNEWHLQGRKVWGRWRIGGRGSRGDDGVRPLTGTEPSPMRHSHPGSFREQAALLRRQFLQDGSLPFTDVLTDQLLSEALAGVGRWLDRVFSPLVTLWVLLGQVLSADHSCRAAIARLNAHRVARGREPCSARTGAYCRARRRLPEAFVSVAACSVGRALDAKALPGWGWKGRRVYLFDGTTVTMPDTPANQAAYPQVHNQGPGVGFPIARLGALISLACGAVVGLGFARYAGKGQGEVSVLRRIWACSPPATSSWPTD